MDDSLERRREDTRQRLLTRSAELHERLRRVREDLARRREPLPKDSSDAAIVVENDEVLQAIEDTALREIDRIQQALARIHAGKFAVCDACDGEIEPDRLRAVPFATQCSHCAPPG